MNKREFLGLKIDLNPGGRLVALYDALRSGCDERMKTELSRDFLRVIVLVGGGRDTNSHNDFKRAVASAQRAGVVIFTIDTGRFVAEEHLPAFSIPATLPRRTGPIILRDLADQTGGVAFLNLDVKDIPGAFAAIEEQIDNMHLLSYVPAEANSRAQYHSLKINPIHVKDKPRLRAPKGYYSGLEVQ